MKNMKISQKVSVKNAMSAKIDTSTIFPYVLIFTLYTKIYRVLLKVSGGHKTYDNRKLIHKVGNEI